MKQITTLPHGHIFVFGSNEAGIHGAGAARDAALHFWAERGTGFGLRGQSFAIPTKDIHIQTLPLASINKYVAVFLDIAARNPRLTFILTPIGCGLAGYTPEDIAPMFRDAPGNVVLPDEFKELP